MGSLILQIWTQFTRRRLISGSSLQWEDVLARETNRTVLGDVQIGDEFLHISLSQMLTGAALVELLPFGSSPSFVFSCFFFVIIFDLGLI